MPEYYATTCGKIINACTGRDLRLHERGVYLSVKLYDNGTAKRRYVHRLVAEEHVPNPHNKPMVNHIDGDKLNNKAENLEWVTHKENCLHRNQVLGKCNNGRRGNNV